MKVYDQMIIVHTNSVEKIEVLDAMLNQYGIDHCFMFCTAKQMEEDGEAEMNLLYMSGDDMTVSLLVMLYCKTALHKSDDEIKNVMKKLV